MQRLVTRDDPLIGFEVRQAANPREPFKPFDRNRGAVGRASDPRRIAETRRRCQSGDGGEVHRPIVATAVTDVAHVLSESHRPDHSRGSRYGVQRLGDDGDGHPRRLYGRTVTMAERHTRSGLIGSSRRECLDHIVIGNERGLCRVLNAYGEYHPRSGTHLSLNKDAPISRQVAAPACTRQRPRQSVGLFSCQGVSVS